MNSFYPAGFVNELVLLRPEIFLGTAACLILMIDLFLSDGARKVSSALSILTVLGAAGLVLAQPWSPHTLALGNKFVLDPMAQVLKVVTLFLVAIVFIMDPGAADRRPTCPPCPSRPGCPTASASDT